MRAKLQAGAHSSGKKKKKSRRRSGVHLLVCGSNTSALASRSSPAALGTPLPPHTYSLPAHSAAHGRERRTNISGNTLPANPNRAHHEQESEVRRGSTEKHSGGGGSVWQR